MRLAAFRCHSVSADKRSDRPSASLRSILPFAKARRVNSPASARRVKGNDEMASSTARTTALPPCRCSSAKSSPVALLGPGKTRTSASSSTSVFPGNRRTFKDACRGRGSFPARPRTTSKATLPLIRMMAIAAGGAPLDSAKIVSAECIYSLFFVFGI